MKFLANGDISAFSIIALLISVFNIINLIASNANNNNNRNNINDNAQNINDNSNTESNANPGQSSANQVMVVPPGAGRKKRDLAAGDFNSSKVCVLFLSFKLFLSLKDDIPRGKSF